MFKNPVFQLNSKTGFFKNFLLAHRKAVTMVVDRIAATPEMSCTSEDEKNKVL